MEGDMGGKKTKERMVSEQTEAWHKPKDGSIFPAKRRSVKRMMWDRVVDPMVDKVNKKNSVFPCSTEPSVDALNEWLCLSLWLALHLCNCMFVLISRVTLVYQLLCCTLLCLFQILWWVEWSLRLSKSKFRICQGCLSAKLWWAKLILVWIELILMKKRISNFYVEQNVILGVGFIIFFLYLYIKKWLYLYHPTSCWWLLVYLLFLLTTLEVFVESLVSTSDIINVILKKFRQFLSYKSIL